MNDKNAPRNRLKNWKVAVLLVLLIGFGVGIMSMRYEESPQNIISGRDYAGPDFPVDKGASRPAEVGILPMPSPAPMPPLRQPSPAIGRPSKIKAEAGKLMPFQQLISQDRMVVSTVSIGLNVTNVTSTVLELRRIAEGLGGFVTESYIEPLPRWKFVERGLLAEPTSRASVTMRIPSDQLDRAISQISSLGKLISFSTTSRDVSEQFVDLNARLKNLQAVLEQYKEIMKGAKTTTDIIAIQQRIDIVQVQVEVTTAQLKRLQTQSSFTAVTVILIEPEVVIEKPKKEEPTLLDRLLLQPLAVALTIAEITVRGLLILIVGLSPLYPIMGFGYIAYRKYSQRQKRDN